MCVWGGGVCGEGGRGWCMGGGRSSVVCRGLS